MSDDERRRAMARMHTEDVWNAIRRMMMRRKGVSAGDANVALRKGTPADTPPVRGETE